MSLPPALAKRPAADPIKLPAPLAGAPLSACFGEFLRRAVPSHAAYAGGRAICEDPALTLRAELYPRGTGDATAHNDFLVAGSVGKRTAVAPLAEVDMLYLLPAKLSAQKAKDALKIAWAVLTARFDGVTLGESGVHVPRGSISIRVLPCRAHAGAYLIPAAGQWSITNPIAEAATLRLSDSLYGGRPRLLMTALKAWRRHAEVPISSFALELLAQEFFATAPRPTELGQALVDFWAWARKRTPCALKPPGGQTAIDVGTEWHGKAKAAYWRATLTEHHVQKGKIAEAAAEWRETLGPLFPLP